MIATASRFRALSARFASSLFFALFALLTLFTSPILHAQSGVQSGFQPTPQTTPSNGDVATPRTSAVALTNARIIVSPTQTLESATLLVRGGVIEAVGAAVVIPADAVVVNCAGKTLCASFIDLDSDYGMPEASAGAARGRRGGFEPQYETATKGAYSWNQALKPEQNAAAMFVTNPTKADELRKLGFGAVLTHVHDGIARGTSVLVALGEGKETTLILKERAAAHYALTKGSSTQDYPNSMMGVIALLRQAYLDARWYKQARALAPATTEVNLSLDALQQAIEPSASLPQIIEAEYKWTSLRADRIGDEAGLQYVIRGAGDEYQRLEDIKATNAAFILPLNFPAAYNVEDPLTALNVPLAALKHWELAPTNPATLEKAGVRFALSAALLKSKAEFMPNLQKALQYGLSRQAALAALTTTPAAIVGMSDKIGTLEKGKVANFLVMTGDPFVVATPTTPANPAAGANVSNGASATITQHWVQGRPFEVASTDNTDLRGTYSLSLRPSSKDANKDANKDASKDDYTLTIKGSTSAPMAELVKLGDTTKIPVTLERTSTALALRFAASTQASTVLRGDLRLSGWLEIPKQSSAAPAASASLSASGTGQDDKGNWFGWMAQRTSLAVPEAAKSDKADTSNPASGLGLRTFPFGEYGAPTLAPATSVLLRNATIWTCEKDGVLRNADILLRGGKVAAIGKNLAAGDAKVIDASGKHVTPGIIDEHSHVALFSLNEGSQSVTSEVRMSDAIDPEDVNIYRQLAGGVTTSHLLHGSANAIGGQTTLVKFRWGANAEAMRFESADGFIKFALGENVKQANWGDAYSVRFPQTRMGVEQVITDGFQRAREYDAAQKTFAALAAKERSQTLAPRRDLELDALAEILNKQRFITCHSYVQSEIAMLMRVAERFGFVVNTFTHILEGYKVADKMKAHGAQASSFSDWWAYKFEVNDAIPYNGAIMHALGINVAFNSDDAEMARRLNQEAAKAVKYGGVPEEEALKFVTLNPAKMLHIDARTGSLKVGKDADVVLWSDHPLSIYARPEKTFVDGTAYFDAERDAALRLEMKAERARLTAKMLKAKRGGAPTQAAPQQRPRELYFHCDSDNNLRGDGRGSANSSANSSATDAATGN
jgi:imidazolonepropionase-like amidohydrolase